MVPASSRVHPDTTVNLQVYESRIFSFSVARKALLMNYDFACEKNPMKKSPVLNIILVSPAHTPISSMIYMEKQKYKKWIFSLSSRAWVAETKLYFSPSHSDINIFLMW